MKKILFDSSIHLGQFCINNENMRVACKNSQSGISAKQENEIVGVVSFNENSWSDHIIWGLEREVQDIFYKFMDVFHSVKSIDRITLSQNDAKLTLDILEKFGLDISNALSCAVAITHKVDEIHTLYPSFVTSEIKDFMKNSYGIKISSPSTEMEMRYSENELEKYYQDALMTFKRNGVNLTEQLHK